MDVWTAWGEASRTALGFFWKAGWAFVLGYWVSGMIQAFVPKGRLTRFMGQADMKSVSLATLFGAASSSCSFAALAAARSLVLKGAHFVAAVAFMFASTNLVIELGILILIFLGWQFLAAEIAGGLVLIAISSLLMRLTWPKRWMKAARENVEAQAGGEEDDFDWRARIRSREGWDLVGHRFVSDWKMVWEEILIGFTIAGFVAVLVPPEVWEAIFLTGQVDHLPGWLIAVENAVVAPFVAAATFIGSMGNIPLATVLDANGVFFAGIMGFIYSDLMVPPLVMINAHYYGWRVALYIAAVMFASIVATALLMHAGFAALGITPESSRQVDDVARFALDYTFWMNLVFVALAAVLVGLHRRYVRGHDGGMDHDMPGKGRIKRASAILALVVVLGGLVTALLGVAPAEAYQAGVYAIGIEDSTCVAPGNATAEIFAWAQATPRKGMVYVTLRISFPENIDRRTPPEFDASVVEVIATDYPDGTSEWNMVLRDCPNGWVRLFRQAVGVLDDRPSTISIHGGDSWIRDCNFELHRVDTVDDLSINDPGCAPVQSRELSWSVLKRTRVTLGQ